MNISRTAFWLSIGIAGMAAVAAACGILLNEGTAFVATTVRGESVDLFGRGIYRYDSLFTGAAFGGTDVVTMLIGVPALLVSLVFARRGSLQARLVLSGMLTFFLYVYGSMALAAAFNPLFLLYVALFSASFFALLLVLRDLLGEAERLSRDLPHRAIAYFLFVSGLLTLIVWLEAPVTSLITGAPPALLGGYTTLVTHALDIAIIVPVCWIVGVMILRGDQRGYIYAFPLLTLLVMLFPVITAQTIAQLQQGIRFTVPEIAGPIGGFLVLGAGGIWILYRVLRSVGPPAIPGARGKRRVNLEHVSGYQSRR